VGRGRREDRISKVDGVRPGTFAAMGLLRPHPPSRPRPVRERARTRAIYTRSSSSERRVAQRRERATSQGHARRDDRGACAGRDRRSTPSGITKRVAPHACGKRRPADGNRRRADGLRRLVDTRAVERRPARERPGHGARLRGAAPRAHTRAWSLLGARRRGGRPRARARHQSGRRSRRSRTRRRELRSGRANAFRSRRCGVPRDRACDRPERDRAREGAPPARPFTAPHGARPRDVGIVRCVDGPAWRSRARAANQGRGRGSGVPTTHAIASGPDRAVRSSS